AQELLRADVAHRLGRPPLLIHRAALATRGGHVAAPLAVPYGRRHQARGTEDVVIRVRPHPEDRAERCRVLHRTPRAIAWWKACPRRGRSSSVLTRTVTRRCASVTGRR